MHKSKPLTFFLSLIPGVGHYYLGLMQRGLQFNMLFFGAIALMIVTDLEPLPLLLPVIWFFCLFDALQAVSATNGGAEVSDRPLIPWSRISIKAAALGWGLVGLGIYTFLRQVLENRYFPLLERWGLYDISVRHFNQAIVSLLLIGFGVSILLRRKAATQEEEGGLQ